MKYVIISIGRRSLESEGEVLYIKANPVKDAGPSFRYLEEMFGKKYFNYSMIENNETVHFIIPFSDSNLQNYFAILERSQEPDDYDSFWSPNMNDFTKVEIRNQATEEIKLVYKHNDLSKPIYSFIPVTDPTRTTVNGEKIFIVSACRRLIGKPFTLDNPEDYIVHYFVYAASEIERYVHETQEARQQNRSWNPDLSHFVKRELTLGYVNRFTGEEGEEKRDLYISRRVSYTNIMDNLNQLLPLFINKGNIGSGSGD